MNLRVKCILSVSGVKILPRINKVDIPAATKQRPAQPHIRLPVLLDPSSRGFKQQLKSRKSYVYTEQN